MKNTTTKSNFPVKKLLFITLTLIALVIIGIIVSIPIRNNLDHNRFTVLDTKSQDIYQSLKKAALEHEQWQYDASCHPVMAGDWETGDYTCTTTASTEKPVTSVAELNALQAKYYPIVNESSELTPKTALDQQPAASFGKQFVVSSVEKDYTMKSVGIECKYILALQQTAEDPQNFSYGSTIQNESGIAHISFTCSNRALGAWYSFK